MAHVEVPARDVNAAGWQWGGAETAPPGRQMADAKVPASRKANGDDDDDEMVRMVTLLVMMRTKEDSVLHC